LIGTGCLLWLAGCQKKPLEFGVAFSAAPEVSAGQSLVYLGQKIGEVRGVDVQSGRAVVKLAVDPQRSKLVFRESRFEIKSEGGLLDRSGRKQIVMEDPESGRTPVRPGDELKGEDPLLVRARKQAGEVITNLPATVLSTVHTFSDYASKANRKWQEFKQTPEGKEFLEALEQGAKAAAAKGSQEFEEFKRDQWPLLKAKAERLRKRMVALGKTKEAEEFWREFMGSADTPTSR
jgi:hypothetical protein